MAKRDYKVGDLFKFRVNETHYGYGQIVMALPHQLKYFSIFDLTTTKEPDLQTIISCKRLIFASSMDTKLDRGEWQIIGNLPVSDHDISLLEYKVSTPNGWVVERFDGTVARVATPDDLIKLSTRKSYSPAAIEYAAKAHFGMVEWKDFCKELILT